MEVSINAGTPKSYIYGFSLINPYKPSSYWVPIYGNPHIPKYPSNGWLFPRMDGFNPPEKYESQIGSSSQLLRKIKFMFQTTNQMVSPLIKSFSYWGHPHTGTFLASSLGSVQRRTLPVTLSMHHLADRAFSYKKRRPSPESEDVHQQKWWNMVILPAKMVILPAKNVISA